MSKLLDKVAEREASRARLLELRRVAAEHQTKAGDAHRAALEALAYAKAETARLIELTREVAQLANADLAGIVGKPMIEVDGTDPTVAPSA